MHLACFVNTKQQVWQKAKECQLDEFILNVSKAFPDAIDGIRIDHNRQVTWWMKSKEQPR